MFAALPPEVNSALMYSGVGSGPLLAAATSWDGLASELNSTATSYESVVASLTSEPWLGSSSALMAAAAAPYVAWMQTTAAQASQTATHIRAWAAAYEVAFTATVPPSAVAANRALLMSLIATNILGQNTAAIGAIQADYAEMWAQDSSAMYSYASSSAAAVELTSFTPPKPETNAGGPAAQAAAVADATRSGAQTITSESMSSVPRILQGLAQPLAAAPVEAVVDDVAATTAVSGLSLGSAYHGVIGSFNFFQRIASQLSGQLTSQSTPTTTDIMERVNRIGLATGAVSPDELDLADGDGHLGIGGLGSWQNWLKWIKGLGGQLGHLGHAALSANIGQASPLGGLSVPPSWAEAAPGVHLASAETPSAGVAAVPAAAGGGVGTVGAQAALTGMAGRALAGAVLPGRESTRSAGRDRDTPSSSAAKEIAEALREYASLRDSGIITDVEFNKHKERLMSLDPLSPGVRWR